MGLVCPSCKAPLGEGSLQVQLEVQIRKHIARYYEGWLVCDDSVCGYRTRMMRVYDRNAEGQCRMRKLCRPSFPAYFSPVLKYDDLQIYNQLLYSLSLFSTEKTSSAAKGTSGQGT